MQAAYDAEIGAGQEPLISAGLLILEAKLEAVVDADRVVVDGENRRVEELRRIQAR